MRTLAFLVLLAKISLALKESVGRVAISKGPSQNGGQCYAPFITDPPVCPMSMGDLYYLCGNYGYNEAADACASFGWRMAMVTESNRPDVEAVVQSCQGPDDSRAWVAGADGMAGDPCAYVLNYGCYVGVIFSTGTEACSEFSIGVVCQLMPNITSVITSTVIASVQSSGTSTQIITSIITETVCTSTDQTSSTETSPTSQLKRAEIDMGRPHIGGYYAPVCQHQARGIRILLNRVDARQAAHECCKYGWSLLDLTDGRESTLMTLLEQCAPDFPIGYVNSYNGLVSNCTSVQLIKVDHIKGIAVGIPINEDWCSVDADFLPICQVQSPFRTGQGAEPGFINITTTTTTTIVTATSPSVISTTTTTCTEYIKPTQTSTSTTS